MHFIDGWRSLDSYEKVANVASVFGEYATWKYFRADDTFVVQLSLAADKAAQTLYTLFCMRISMPHAYMIACPLLGVHLCAHYKQAGYDHLSIKATSFVLNLLSKLVSSVWIGDMVHHAVYGEEKQGLLMWGTTAAMLGMAVLNLREGWNHLKRAKNATT